mmetsp:Transcript_60067/g.159756  ORF Transcript_60067/g.159756 Transcript_60067/m.159756 type:complete len:157 (+) Transcript_60067:335-805(+)
MCAAPCSVSDKGRRVSDSPAAENQLVDFLIADRPSAAGENQLLVHFLKLAERWTAAANNRLFDELLTVSARPTDEADSQLLGDLLTLPVGLMTSRKESQPQSSCPAVESYCGWRSVADTQGGDPVQKFPEQGSIGWSNASIAGGPSWVGATNPTIS